MSDKDKGHVPDWPKREVSGGELRAALRECHSTQNFVWLAKGEEHFATVYYDCNGMAIGYKDRGHYYIFD